MMSAVDERLVVRWSLSTNMGATMLVLLFGAMCFSAAAATTGAWVRAAFSASGTVTFAAVAWWVRRRRLVLTRDALAIEVPGRQREIRWVDVVAVSWRPVASKSTGVGWSPVVRTRDGRLAGAATPVLIGEAWVSDVNAWLREHQREIRIDPRPPWRDRFGTWHVAEPGYDPVETMRSIRRSLVGPWEVTTTSCEGGFRARQVRVHSGELVAESPVRATLREAVDDGVALVREAVAAAGSATE